MLYCNLATHSIIFTYSLTDTVAGSSNMAWGWYLCFASAVVAGISVVTQMMILAHDEYETTDGQLNTRSARHRYLTAITRAPGAYCQ